MVLPGSQVLTDEGRKCHGHTHNRKENESLNLGVGPHSGHSVSAEGIDILLNHQVADGDHGILNAGGQTLIQHLLHHVGMVMQLFEIKPGIIFNPTHTKQTENDAETLRDHSGGCSTCNTPVKGRMGHKKQIQTDIHNGRE